MLKKTMLALDILAIITIAIAPALFVPSYFFSGEVSTVAIIGGGHPPFVIMTVDKAKWGNFLFPLLMILVAFNLHYFYDFIKRRVRKD